jgi:hypothetical protein
MSLLKPIAVAVIASLLAAPAYAEPANPAAKLSLAPGNEPIRAPSPTRKSERLTGAALPLILLGTAAVVGAALLLGNSDSTPASN